MASAHDPSQLSCVPGHTQPPPPRPGEGSRQSRGRQITGSHRVTMGGRGTAITPGYHGNHHGTGQRTCTCASLAVIVTIAAGDSSGDGGRGVHRARGGGGGEEEMGAM